MKALPLPVFRAIPSALSENKYHEGIHRAVNGGDPLWYFFARCGGKDRPRKVRTMMSNQSVSARNTTVKKLVSAGVCLALCLVLPFLTGNIPQIGSALSPMHIPVLLCGFICGWPYGLAVGFAAPLLRHLLFHMPPMPAALSMAFELAAYGVLTGVLYRLLPRKPFHIYVTLIVSMLLGRVVWGAAQVVVLGLSGSAFSWQAFMAGAFINGIPGIICHIVLIPIIVFAWQKARLMPDG